ncbi:hypothetical protein [Novosphingobium sp. FKTRR1]|uniref:hypothetical protein n=1 Tax=Novosphingobium sp. FKTRR1 TaxID=2879118 RepID=UPI001CEFF4A6|nr:hypothetical protein [Novosphingobium sp. FKTRR1]
MPVVLKSNTSAKLNRKAQYHLAGVSALAFGASLVMPQPLHATDTTISNTIVSVPQTVSGSIGQFSITSSGTISTASEGLVVDGTGDVASLSNDGTLFGATAGAHILSGGHIGTITNTGMIGGGDSGPSIGGIANEGSIDTIFNNGTVVSSKSSGIGNLSNASIGRIINNGLISGVSGGIFNNGTIGQIANTGTIIGAQAGIGENYGTIGTLDNSGTISSDVGGMYIGNGVDSVLLGTLLNSGTITAPTALLISPSASLGGISDTGLIAGQITNLSSNDLIIDGGIGAVVGTLTGYWGHGLISNAASDLVFSTGNLLLDDDIDATGHTVINSGANLALNSQVNVTGDVSQINGTLAIDPVQGGLIASGAVVISGGTVQSDFVSTGNYTQGTYTLVSGSSLNTSGSTILVGSLAGLSRSLNTTSTAVLLSIANDYVGGTLATLDNSAAITAASTGLYVAATGSIGAVTNSGTLGGSQFGVNNLGQIGTFSNSGRITNTNFTALWNQGSIGQLVNTGTITNSSWAILNTGTIGTITNSGVIAGAGNAIQNYTVVELVSNSGTMSGGSNAIAGNFATIANSGTILGNINGNGGTIGTIVGGGDGTIGTFTGFDGTSQGTIGASANLTFASGALLLNDTILAKSIPASSLTISNVGADIALAHTVTIDANYQQSAGSLNLGSTGKLVVTQAASFTGGTIVADLSAVSTTGNYLVGDIVGGTLVAGGTGSNYSGVSLLATGSLSGLAVAATTSGNNLLMAADNDYIDGTLTNLTIGNTIVGPAVAFLVADTGVVGSLTNNGTLHGAARGLRNLGVMDTVVNYGLIEGPVGLENDSTISALGNAGTLLGVGGASALGLYNGATIGLFVNAGLIGATATEGGFGFLNSDVIGTLVNLDAGIISAQASSATGLANYGTIGALANAGTIVGSSAGVSNYGAIGLIENTGTIKSANDAMMTGLYNAGSIGTLSNSGLIGNNVGLFNTGGTIDVLENAEGGTIGGEIGIFNSGSIGSLTNGGLITGASVGLYLADSLGTLVNAGTIASSAGYAVHIGASGALGGISNSGLISGTILNESANNLTIDGGGGAAVGTLTGSNGHGLISNTASDLVFASGNLLLDDNIDATGHTVVNSGANLKLNTLTTITGDYSQTGGALGIDAQHGGLLVSNGATISGGLIVPILSSTGNYLHGSSTLISAASLDLTGSNVSINAPIEVDASTHLDGSQLLLTIANDYVGGTLATLNNGDAINGAGFGLFIASTGSVETIVNNGSYAGGYTGVVNRGSVGTLSNHGQITTTSFTALWNAGSIGQLTNTGTISGAFAVNNSGTIDMIANSGVIEGGATGIGSEGSIELVNNSGTMSGGSDVLIGDFGTIANSGTILGNINTSGGTIGTILGGANGAVGTFTGIEGSQGTFGASANLTFASGALLLDDTIVAVGTASSSLTVSNVGADIGLSRTVTIDANYQQTAGSLNLGSAGRLVVTQAATFTGGTIATDLSGLSSASNYLAGDTLGEALVFGGEGSSYAGVSIVSTGGLTGLEATSGVSGTNLVARALNDYIGGSLGSLSNTGNLSAATAVYVAASGSLGSLTNSGTLSGSNAAIHNAGALGPITNTGVIAGNIDNLSAQALQISGGTLTGYAANTQGTITNTLGNVVLTGAIALNDAINVGDHTVVNDGGSLSLANTVNVTGGFSQSSGALTLASGAQLVVSGAASFTGGTIATSVSGTANYLAGSAAGTLIQGGTGSGYDGVTVQTGSVTGLALQAQTSGTNLVARALNDYIGGSLGSLSNTGNLSAATAVYVAASGSLGSLTNSGTLTGSNAAIHNAGALGPITNTGVIAGNVTNEAAADLAIAGGSDGSFGTLTGYADGSQGTITNTGGNLVLTGNIMFNDAVNVGSHGVVVNGGTLSVNKPVAITGNYNQTGGKLLIGVTSTAAYGQLQVSGSASLTGTNVTLVKLGTGTIASGQSYAVVKASGSLSYSNLTASVAGLDGAFSTASSGGASELVLTLSDIAGTISPPPPVEPTRFAPTGVLAGGPGVGTGAALDLIADSGGSAAIPVITDILLPLAVLPGPEQERGIIQLAPSQLAPQVIAVAVSPAVNAIVQHQDILAANATGRQERGLSAGSQGRRGAIWGQFLVSGARRSNSPEASAYKASNYGVMAGADLASTSSLVAGAAISWVNSSAYGRGQIAGSRVTLDSFQATAYFSLHSGGLGETGLVFDGQFGFGFNHYSQRRQIDFLQATAQASYNGQQYLGNLRASYTIPLAKFASVTPYASIREVHLHNAGYAETGGGAANLKVHKLDVDVFGHELGVQAASIFETASGQIAPNVKLAWAHNYSNGAIPIEAVLGGVTFSSESARTARNGAVLGAGLSFKASDRFMISAQYDGELRRDFKSHSGTVKLTVNF